MSRTQIVLDGKGNPQYSAMIEEILDSHKFDKVQKNGEEYWQQGIGVTQSPKFIKYYFEGNNLILEGWVSNFGKESDLGGAIGALPKRSCKKILNEIEDAVKKQPANVQPVSTQPAVSEDVKEKVETTQEKKVASDEDVTKAAFEHFNNRDKGVSNVPPAPNANYVSNAGSSTTRSSSSKGIIPRRYRGSIIWNIIEIILAIIYIIGASSGYLVLRFTNSSGALIIVALIMLAHGSLALISNLQDS